MKVSHDWLKEYLGDNAPSANEIESLLNFHAFEVEAVDTVGDDSVIDVDILPNRSSDCLCHRGIAREIATLTSVPLKYDPLTEPVTLTTTDQISVEIESAADCPRFTASLITGVKVGESPEWLKRRLEALGQRSINNIVDATNYVMYAIGQPLHAYDADKFPQASDTWQFVVRRAEAAESISLLAEGGKGKVNAGDRVDTSGHEDRIVELTGNELLIVDGSSNTPIGLAGVKGGRFAEVDADTKNIIVEAAHFNPTLTRATARRLGIVIDASKRFENEPSRELPPYAQRDIIELITKLAGGEAKGVLDIYLERQQSATVTVVPERANGLLGLDLAVDEMQQILERAGIAVTRGEETLECMGPWERTDLYIEEDFIEEIGRIHGLSHIQSVVPETVALPEINVRQYYSERVRQTLIGLGFSEVVTSSFRKKDQIQLQNALATDKSYLRSSLIRNLNDVLDKNAGFTDLLGTNDTRVFEIGTVFEKTADGLAEHVALGIGIRLKPSGYSGKEDKQLEAVLTELESALGTTFDRTAEKGVAEINFTALLTKLPVPEAYEPVIETPDVQYQPYSVYQHMSRDIALWIGEDTTAAKVEQVLNDSAGPLRVRTTLFDEFSKDGRKSVAFRLVFQASDRTLTDEEINTLMEQVYAAVTAKGWEVR